MPHYYFDTDDGESILDGDGMELPDIAAAQNEALRTAGDLLKGAPSSTAPLWKGTPWRLWVTDKPNGDGKTLFTLRFTAEM